MHFSEDDKVVCQTPSLSNEEILNEPQAVKVSWLNTEIPVEETRYNFTYKADPQIKDIEPKLTIIGYTSPILSGNYFSEYINSTELVNLPYKLFIILSIARLYALVQVMVFIKSN